VAAGVEDGSKMLPPPSSDSGSGVSEGGSGVYVVVARGETDGIRVLVGSVLPHEVRVTANIMVKASKRTDRGYL
jgi:hypothetical protein